MNKKRTIILVITLVLFLGIIGITYAWFSATILGNENASNVIIKSGSLNLLYEDGQEINLNNAMPGDSESKIFTVTNTANSYTYYSIDWVNIINDFTDKTELVYTLELINNDNHSLIRVIKDNEIVPSEDIAIENNIQIQGLEKHTYKLTITFKKLETNQNYNQGKRFSGKINISGIMEPTYCEINNCNELRHAILNSYDGPDAIQELPTSTFESPTPLLKDNGLSPIETTYTLNSTFNYYWGTSYTFDETTGLYELTGKTQGLWDSSKVGKYTLVQTINQPSRNLFLITKYNSATQAGVKMNNEVTSVETSEGSGLFKVADDYGESYYFRGHRDYINNNVLFAGFQWKIIRINGDGSIRMIYNGTEAQFNTNGTVNTTGANTQAGTRAYNASHNDNTYVGYKYGNSGATTYEATHSNLTDSPLKTNVDSWYANNIANKDTTITSKVVDKIFCNDRQINTITGEWTLMDKALGYGTNITYYATYNRVVNIKNPKLTCTQENDQYTVASGRLTYPVGLITADEAALAGGRYSTINKSYYLYTNQYYWTMSPAYLNGSAAIFFVNDEGYILFTNVTPSYGFRPVINLASDVTISSGDGTSSNPYRIS